MTSSTADGGVLPTEGDTAPEATVTDTASSDGAASDSSSTDDFFIAYASAICKHLFACPPPDNDEIGLRNVFVTEAHCNEIAPDFLRRTSGAELTFRAVTAGQLSYDPARAASCFDSLGSCGVPLNTDGIAACREMFEGTTPSGGGCERDPDCAGDAYCGAPSSAAATCGSCTPRKPAGSPCLAPSECAAPAGYAACRPAEAGWTCAPYSLGSDAIIDHPCGFLTPNTLTPCGPALWCETGAADSGTCRAPLTEGATCRSTDDVCRAGLACASADGAITCQTVSVGRNVGDRCGASYLAPCDPFSSLVCQNAMCARYGDGSQGSACSSHDLGELTCQAGLVCGADQTCIAPRKEGESCRSSSECETGSCSTVCSACQAHGG